MDIYSAGLLVYYNEKILLVQQNNDTSGNRLSIPKGRINSEESPLNAAIRETYEETGILILDDWISKEPHLLTVKNKIGYKLIIYYKVHLKNDNFICQVKEKDTSEIIWAGFVNYKDAIAKIQISQIAVLNHIKPNKIEQKAISFLIRNGYITREEHFSKDIYIYNYTEKCKKERYWNEITLWCRGLIMDKYNNILYRPLKKFFEEKQLYSFFVPQNSEEVEVYEKLDGSFGILYWIDNLPFITTRGSFISNQAIIGTSLLYRRYLDVIRMLNNYYSYFFEIISPEDCHIVNYNGCEDLFLIGAFDNKMLSEINFDQLKYLPFSKVKCINTYYTLDELKSRDIFNKEGYVLRYRNGQRIKIKFSSYKKLYLIKYGY